MSEGEEEGHGECGPHLESWDSAGSALGSAPSSWRPGSQQHVVPSARHAAGSTGGHKVQSPCESPDPLGHCWGYQHLTVKELQAPGLTRLWG